MKNSNGYSRQNYLIDSASKATMKASVSSACLSITAVLSICVTVVRLSLITAEIAFVFVPIAFILWLLGWWVMFERAILNVHWLAYEGTTSPTPPETKEEYYNLYQLEDGNYKLGSRGGAVDKSSEKV